MRGRRNPWHAQLLPVPRSKRERDGCVIVRACHHAYWNAAWRSGPPAICSAALWGDVNGMHLKRGSGRLSSLQKAQSLLWTCTGQHGAMRYAGRPWHPRNPCQQGSTHWAAWFGSAPPSHTGIQAPAHNRLIKEATNSIAGVQFAARHPAPIAAHLHICMPLNATSHPIASLAHFEGAALSVPTTAIKQVTTQHRAPLSTVPGQASRVVWNARQVPCTQ